MKNFYQLIRSVDQIIQKMFFFSKKNIIIFKKNYQLIKSAADQLISKSARSDQLVRSNQQVISDDT